MDQKVTINNNSTAVNKLNNIQVVNKVNNPNLIARTDTAAFLVYVDNITSGTYKTLLSLINQINVKENYRILFIKQKVCQYNISNEEFSELQKLFRNPKVITLEIDEKKRIDEVNAWAYTINRIRDKYLLFVKNGDICEYTRLSNQLNYMRCHDNAIMISSSVDQKYQYEHITEFNLDTVNKYDMGTCCINMDKFKELDFIFEPYWEGMFFDKFLLYAITHNKEVYTTPHVVTTLKELTKKEIEYRQRTEQILKNLFIDRKETNNVFSIVIPFKNEGIEIEKTVMSIRGTTNKFTQIILIDDTSDDNCDYKWVADKYKCVYHKNKENLGVARSRDLGIFNYVLTPYFIILDGHMRFYELGWDDYVCKLIKKYPNDILCAASKEMTKDKKFYYNEDGKDMILNCVGTVLDKLPDWKCNWNNKDHYSKSEVISIPCVLGACYISSVEHWKEIGGLKFLEKYGLDEQLMSIKNWMMGYKNLYIYAWGVGHFYKINEGQNTLKGLGTHIAYNNVMMTYLFNRDYFEEHINELVKNSKINKEKLLDIFKKNANELDIYREEFLSKAKYTFEDFKEFNQKFIDYRNNRTVIILGGTNEIPMFLNKGYTVISYEPNKVVYFKLKNQLKDKIKTGQLQLYYDCVWSKTGETKDFYIDINNMAYASLDKEMASVTCTNPDDLMVTPVKTISLEDILKKYKNPELLRISICGYEEEILNSLKTMNKKLLPKYVTIPTEVSASNEHIHNKIIDILSELGYKTFHLFENEHELKFGDNLEIDKSTWITANMIKMVAKINKEMYFKNNPKNKIYQYRNCLHARL